MHGSGYGMEIECRMGYAFWAKGDQVSTQGSERRVSRYFDRVHVVGTVPPSIRYSVPVMEAARGEARKATSSATSLGRDGRPIGMPPSESIKALRAPSYSD